MKLDFTQENLSNIDQLFNSNKANDNYDIAARAGQLKSTYSKVLAKIGGYGLLNTIMIDNNQLADMKNTFKNQLETVFNNVSALDLPYAQESYNALIDLQNAMTALSNASTTGAGAITKGKLDQFTPDTILKMTVVSGIKLNSCLGALLDQGDEQSLDRVKTVIKDLSKITNYDVLKELADCNPYIKKALEEAQAKIKKGAKEDQACIEACTIVILDIANTYGRQNSKKLSPEETERVFNNMLENNNALNAKLQKMKVIDKYSKFTRQCVDYDVKCYDGTSLDAYLYGASQKQLADKTAHPNGKSVLTTTSPFYAALAGEMARDEAERKGAQKYNNGQLAPYCAGLIDIGRSEKRKPQEPMKIKLPGDDEMIELPATQKMDWKQQRKVVSEANVITGGSILLFNKTSVKKDGKTIHYNQDEDQYHAAIATSSDRYASASNTTDVWNRSYDHLLEKNKPGYNGMDVILVNVDEDTWNRLTQEHEKEFSIQDEVRTR